MEQSFIKLKTKIISIEELTQQYRDKVNYIKNLKSDLESAKAMTVQKEVLAQKEAEFKKHQLDESTKFIKLKRDYTALELLKQGLEEQVAKQEKKLTTNVRNLQQLNNKIKQLEQEHKDKLLEVEFEKASLKIKVKDLEREIRDMKSSQQLNKDQNSKQGGRKQNSPFKTSRDTGLIPLDDLPETTLAFPEPRPLQESRGINVNITKEREKSPETPKNNSVSLPLKKPETCDKNVMTDEFYSLKNNAYPLFCDKCSVLIEKPVEKIFKAMTDLPQLLPPLPSSPRRPKVVVHEPKPSGADSAPDVSIALENLQQKLQTLERSLKKRKKQGITRKYPYCNHTPPVNCCGHNNTVNDQNFSQVNMMAAFWDKMMQFVDKRPPKHNPRPQKTRKKQLKRQQVKVKDTNIHLSNWDIESETTMNDQDSAIDLEPPIPLIYTPLLKSPTKNHDMDDESFSGISDRQMRLEETPQEADKTIRLSECYSELLEYDRRSRSITRDTNSSSLSPRGPSPSLVADQMLPRKRKRYEEASKSSSTRSKLNLLTKLRRFKKNQSSGVVPSRAPRFEDNLNYQNEANHVEPVPGSKKRIAHVPKSDINKPQKTLTIIDDINNDLENISAMKRRRVTRSMKRSEDSLTVIAGESTKVKLISPPRIVERRRKRIDVPEIVIKDMFGIEYDNSAVDDVETVMETSTQLRDASKAAEDLPEDQETPAESENVKNHDIEPNNVNIITENTELTLLTVENQQHADRNDETDDESMEMNVQEPLKAEELDKVELFPEKMEIGETNDVLDNDKIIPKAIPLSQNPSPASPDSNKPFEVPLTSQIPSIYDSVMISDSTPAPEPIKTSSPPKHPIEDPQMTLRVSKPLNNNYTDCVRELRNRKVPISPSKVNSSVSAGKTRVLEQHENIQTYLERHLMMNKRKSNQKHGRYQQEAAIKASKDAEATINQDLRRLIDSGEWDNAIHESVVDNLAQIPSSRSIAKCVVTLIVELSASDTTLDTTNTPPAPLMTKSQQRIVTLLKSLEVHKPNLIPDILAVINYHLFMPYNHPGFQEAESLGRIFVILSRMTKDRERVRIMVCDALYSLQRKAYIILYAVLSNWPEVLSSYDNNQLQYLPICIALLIKMYKPMKEDSIKVGQIKRLLKGIYNYPDDLPSSKEQIERLLAALVTENHDRSILTAIILLSKKEGPTWTYKNVIHSGLLKIIVENNGNPRIYDALRLLGFLMRVFPLIDEDGAVKKIVEQLCAILDEDTVAIGVQEGVVSALLSLARHRFEDVARSVLAWRPSRCLPPKLQEQLQSFFNARPAEQWNKVKGKHKKDPTSL